MFNVNVMTLLVFLAYFYFSFLCFYLILLLVQVVVRTYLCYSEFAFRKILIMLPQFPYTSFQGRKGMPIYI